MAEKKPEVAEERQRPMGWLQLMGEIRRTMKANMGDPIPPEFRQHMQASHKERLLAMRSLIDARIAHIEELEAQAKERKVTKISVQ
jgi:hypothetical protein